MREGVRLGIDVGQARVGVSRSTPDATVAVPVATLARATAMDEIMSLVSEWEPLELIVGLPINLQGKDTPSTDDARAFAQELVDADVCPVRMVDERFSTRSASSQLQASGKNSREQRPVIDQVAAVILLQHSLDAERLQGVAPGFLLETN